MLGWLGPISYAIKLKVGCRPRHKFFACFLRIKVNTWELPSDTFTIFETYECEATDFMK